MVNAGKWQMRAGASVAAVAACLSSVFASDEHLRYSMSFDDETAPLAADVGAAATVVTYGNGIVEEREGLGGCSLVTDATIKAGLSAGSGALTIPVGQALRIAHGIATGRTTPWCIAMRVYVPSIVSGKNYASLFNLYQGAVGDASLAIRGNAPVYDIGGGNDGTRLGWSGKIQQDAWHVVVCSMDVDRTRLYVDGQMQSDRNYVLDKFHASRMTLLDRPYVFISADNDEEDNTLHFDWIKVYDTAKPQELFGNGVSCHDFDGTDALAATMGLPAKIVNYNGSLNPPVSEVSGLGNWSVVSDVPGLAPGSKALLSAKGQALRIAHGVDTSAKRPWGLSVRVLVPTDSAKWTALFATDQDANEDAALWIGNNLDGTFSIGSTGFLGYYPFTAGEWHVVTLLTDEKQTSLFVDGHLLVTKDHTVHATSSRLNLTNRPYVFIGGDNSNEDGPLYFDWVKVFDHANADDALISKYATWSAGGWIIKDRQSDETVGGTPDAATEIRLDSETAMTVPVEAPLKCARVVVRNTVALASDLDWRGLGLTPWRIEEGAALDLNGHRLDVPTLRAEGFHLAVTSTAANVSGIFCAETAVPEKNDSFVFGGNVRFIKSGTSDLAVFVERQCHTGGTVIASGRLACGFSPESGALGAADTDVHVATGAVLDMWGRTGLERHRLCLDGGVLTSTPNALYATASSSENRNWTLGNVLLTADSRFEFSSATETQRDVRVLDGSTWDLGGYVLDLAFAGNDPDFYTSAASSDVHHLILKNGLLRVRGNGYFHDYGIDGTQGGSLDLDCILRLQVQTSSQVSKACDFRVGPDYTSSNALSGGKMWIYGAFRPDSEYCFQIELRNGASLDLSGFDAAWPLTFKPLSDGKARTTAFESGSEIVVKLGERTFENSAKIVDWELIPQNVKFALEPGHPQKIVLRKREDGLYVEPKGGFALFVR